MSRALMVKSAGPGLTVQDTGRPGYLTFGLSRSGAADMQAVAEGAALLGQETACAVLEMASMGGTFEAVVDMRIALTGAPMRATLAGAPLAWNASHLLPAGSELSIGPALEGVYGYLSVGGGFATASMLGSRSAHLAGGLHGAVAAGTELPVGPDPRTEVNQTLPVEPRFNGGTIRIVASAQTDLFSPAERTRFTETSFKRDTRANRMGARLLTDGAGFAAAEGLTILSEAIVPGDIQITGDGTPFVLLSESQTTGGYPRIGSVLPSDLGRVAQAPAGATLRFSFVDLEDAVAIERAARAVRDTLSQRVVPLVRDPRKMRDLLSHQMISGVTDGSVGAG
ncbi:MAG: biotin-dependent carboxyltransferase family protein [Pseudomonadota bacterium]